MTRETGKLLKDSRREIEICAAIFDYTAKNGPDALADEERTNPDDPAARVSHETIHAAICAQPRGGLKTAMTLALRQHEPTRGRSLTTWAGGSIAPESLRIIHRPEENEARLVPGHWPCGDAGVAYRLTGR